MRFLPWILLLASLAGVVSLGRLVHENTSLTAEDLLADAKTRLEQTPPDLTGASRDLRLGITMAEQASDDATLQELLLTQGQMHRKNGLYELAVADYERLLTLPDFDPITAYIQLGEIELLEEDVDASLSIVSSILEVEPEHAAAWELRGEAHRLRADRMLEALREDIRTSLPKIFVPEALEILDRLAHLPVDVARRAALQNDFDRLFEGPFEEELGAIRPRIAEVSEVLARARSAFHRSLQNTVRREAAYLLLEILLRSGDATAVVDLGQALRAHRSIATDLRTTQLIARALADVDRPRAAAQVIEEALDPDSVNVRREFLPVWAEILYDNETWGRLANVAAELARKFQFGAAFTRERDSSDFFRGLALVRIGSSADGAQFLRSFVNSAKTEPVPDARAIAWRELADLERDAADRGAYMNALNRIVKNAPDYSAVTWLELADIREERESPPNAVQEALTNAMRLDPELVPTSLERWHALGARTLEENGRDIEQIVEILSARGQWTSPDNNYVYEQYQLALAWLEEGRANGAISAAHRILDRFPRFLPVFDLLVETYIDLGREDLAIPMLVERLEFAPDDPWGRETLRTLEAAGYLTQSNRFDLMRLDPRHSGLIEMSAAMLDDGASNVVADAFARAGREEVGTSALILAARAELAEGNGKRVLSLLAPVATDDPEYCRAVGLRIEACIATGDLDGLDGVIDAYAPTGLIEPTPLLDAAEKLMVAELAAQAQRFLTEVDSNPAARSGDLVARRALAELMARDFIAARESLERSLAFRDDGFVELGELLMSVQEERYSDLRRAALSTRAATEDLTPFASCLLSALEGRHSEALAIAAEGETNQVNDAPWGLARMAIQALAGEPLESSARHGALGKDDGQAMVLGTPDSPHDPRWILAVLLTVESDDWAPWAAVELTRRGRSTGRIWRSYLHALAELTLGEEDTARGRLVQLTREAPDFAPAWVRLERLELERVERIEHPIMLKLRAARSVALGEDPGASLDAILARAAGLEQSGKLLEAAQLVREVLDLDPENPIAQLLLGRQLLLIGRTGEAIRTFGRFFAEVDPAVTAPYVPEFLTLLSFAETQGTLDDVGYMVELDALEARHPDDPAIVAARAVRDLLAAPTLEIGLGRMWKAFERFDRDHPTTALDDIREGASREWFDLMVDYDPSRAETFALEQLSRRPTEIDLWLMLGEAYVGEGRRVDATAHYERIIQMVPEPRALEALAEIVADLGSDHRRVTQLLEQVAEVENIDPNDPRLRMIRARSLVNAGGMLLDGGLEQLTELWTERRKNEPKVDPGDLALTLGIALLHRADSDDRKDAEAILEEALRLTDPDQINPELLTTLKSLAPRIPRPKPSPDS